jgi:hypothetical protein
MNINKFLVVGFTTLLSTFAIAAPQPEDFSNTNNSACMVAVNDSSATRFINVNYIRLIQVTKEEDQKVNILMASNYDNQETRKFQIKYQTPADAIKSMNNLRDQINDCQYDAAERRSKRKQK